MTPYQKIKTYLTSGDIDPIWDDYDVLTWVDWRDEDSYIVNYFSDYVGNDDAGKENLYSVEKDDYNVDIVYKNKAYPIPYPNDYADRDTTLTFLNETISDEYQIRFVSESDGSDTLAFVILNNEEWKTLEDEFGTDIVENSFQKLKRGKPIFGE